MFEQSFYNIDGSGNKQYTDCSICPVLLMGLMIWDELSISS